MDPLQIEVCTLGMFILDDIYPRKSDPDQEPKINVIGGAGTYAALGARLFCPGLKSRNVGWIVDTGIDFPEHVLRTIESWQTAVVIRPRAAPTTRGWNAYVADEHRAFKYLTKKKRIVADDLDEELLRSHSFHLICSAERCQTLVEDILARRSGNAPIFVWEPVPDQCTTAELEAIASALRIVDVVSPNHEELATMFGDVHPAGSLDGSLVESHADKLLRSGIGAAGGGSVIVRCGKSGAYAADRTRRFWTPAYHTDETMVVDPTGGGNSFLGGLALGLARQKSLEAAVRMASVAASYCIEQVGPPVLETANASSAEKWNGNNVSERLEHFTKICDMESKHLTCDDSNNRP